MTNYTITLSFDSEAAKEEIQKWIDNDLIPEMPDDTDVVLTRNDVFYSIDELDSSQYGRIIVPTGKTDMPTGTLTGVFPEGGDGGYNYSVVVDDTIYSHIKGYDVVKIKD